MSGNNGVNIRDVSSDDQESEMDASQEFEEARRDSKEPPDVDVIHPDISYVGFSRADQAAAPKHLFPTEEAAFLASAWISSRDEVVECEAYNVSDVYPNGMNGVMHCVVWYGTADSVLDAALKAQLEDWWTKDKEARFSRAVSSDKWDDLNNWQRMNRRHFLVEAGGSEDPDPFPAKPDAVVSRWPVHYVMIGESRQILRHFRMPADSSEWSGILKAAIALETEDNG